MSKKIELSWEPKRRGDIYCAPACGAGCTHQAYLQAVKDAEVMASKAKGFSPLVTENMGWYARAEALKRHIIISGYPGDYLVIASTRHPHAGNMTWGTATGKTPQKAVDTLKRKLRRHIAKLQKFLEQIEALNERK